MNKIRLDDSGCGLNVNVVKILESQLSAVQRGQQEMYNMMHRDEENKILSIAIAEATKKKHKPTEKRRHTERKDMEIESVSKKEDDKQQVVQEEIYEKDSNKSNEESEERRRKKVAASITLTSVRKKGGAKVSLSTVRALQ